MTAARGVPFTRARKERPARSGLEKIAGGCKRIVRTFRLLRWALNSLHHQLDDLSVVPASTRLSWPRPIPASSRVLHPAPDALGRDGEIADRHIEGGESVLDGVGNGRGTGNGAALAHALGAEGREGRGMLHSLHLDGGDVRGGGL